MSGCENKIACEGDTTTGDNIAMANCDCTAEWEGVLERSVNLYSVVCSENLSLGS